MRTTAMKSICTALLVCLCSAGNLTAQENQLNTNNIMEEKLNLTQEWDKVFPLSDEVNHSKITFHMLRNRHPDCMHRNWLSAAFSQ